MTSTPRDAVIDTLRDALTSAGDWRMPQADPTNQARSSLPGRIVRRPRQRWSMGTGGDVTGAAVVDVDGVPWVVALAGSVLQAQGPPGAGGWSLPRRPVSRLITTGDLDGTGAGCILARGSQQELLLLDARTGGVRWRWVAPDGTFINDSGAVLLLPIPGGQRLVVAPIYATYIVCFDLVGAGPPVERWRLEGDWDAGFGPSLIAADMDGQGQPDLVLSSRMGSSDRTRHGASTSSELVLGRQRGSLYQVVADLSTGEVRRSVAWAPNGRGYRCARPYGLLTAVPFRPGARPGIVLVCCQVEEYLAVTRRGRDGSLRRGWGRFVEKDWPRDAQELRVHPDSCRDVDGDGAPELIVSLWDGVAWQALVLDPGSATPEPRATLADRVHWGTLDRADGGAALLVGVATERQLTAPATLELLDGATHEVLDRIHGASVVVGPAEPLPVDTAFMAERRGLTRLRGTDADATDAVVVRLEDGSLAAWSVDDAGRRHLQRIGGQEAIAVHGGSDRPLLVGRTGRVRHLERAPGATSGAWQTRAGVTATGRAVQPLVRATATGPQLVVGHADGTIVGGAPAGRGALRDAWHVRGVHPAPLRAVGVEVLAVMEVIAGDPVLRILPGDRPDPTRAISVPLEAPLDRPVSWLPDRAMVLTLRTSTHVLATEVRELDGTLRWRADTGAYFHPPAAATIDGVAAVILDDHGILRRFSAVAGHAPEAGAAARQHPEWQRDWTAAYSMPVVGTFLPSGRSAILRANGIHGLELLDSSGRSRWRTGAELWRYSAGRAAVARLPDGTSLVIHPRRDGVVDGVDVATGVVRWTLAVTDVLEHAAVAVGDIDGDGMDECILGLPEGRLLCLGQLDGPVRTRWSVDVGAGVTAIALADIDGDGMVEVILGTSDGRVRLFR